MTEKLNKEELINAVLVGLSGSNLEQNKKELVDLIAELSEFEDVCRSYPEITHVIYRMDVHTFQSVENFFGLYDSNNDFAGLRQEEKLDGLSNDKKENLNRFERHVKLSCYQREYINKLATEAEEAAKKARDVSEDAEKHAEVAQKVVTTVSLSVKDTKKVAQNANKIAQRASETANKADKIANKAQSLTNQIQGKMTGIYSEFVGILAIFTALSFAMMGSVQMLGNLFNDIKHPTTGTLGYALILAGIYLIVIYLLIMTLVLAMKKLFSTISEEYRISWPFVWIISIVSTLLIVVGIFFIVFFKVSDLWTFYR
ncbi:MAG TPA: hypothetical protein IAB27_06705 [Candidatus Coprosoma intestinipullorum]|uniref:Uncharacterized protein n=1 Tax=Candidatus Coprosoma intestinipullorum TaxID=2840752 RepID=A0A9D1D0B9_9FIRM|nr:hypothetical protein [Candidatus Coprosoma intestinipullorum]